MYYVKNRQGNMTIIVTLQIGGEPPTPNFRGLFYNTVKCQFRVQLPLLLYAR